MFEFGLIRSAVLGSEWRYMIALRVENQSLPRRIEMPRAGSHVPRRNASRKDRTHHDTGNNIFLRFEKGFPHPVDGRAARHAARDLRDHEARKFQLTMPPAEFDQG